MRTFPAALATAVFLALSVPAPADITSEYYLTSYYSQHINVLQGTGIDRGWIRPNHWENAIAVNGTVRTLDVQADYDGGREYDLYGNPTGPTYSNPLADPTLTWDGTTDGQFNYGWDAELGTAYRFDLDWTSPVALFSVGGQGDYRGITYDPTNNSLWIAGRNVPTIANYAMDGTLLTSFSYTRNGMSALALDYADDTLWFQDWWDGSFRQYSKTGIALSTLP